MPVEKQSLAAITKQVEEAAKKGRVRVLAPLIKARKGFHTEVAAWAVKHGFEELLVDGRFMSAFGFEKLERFREHTIDVSWWARKAAGRRKSPRLKTVEAKKGEGEKKGKGRVLKNAATLSEDPREIVKKALEIGKGNGAVRRREEQGLRAEHRDELPRVRARRSRNWTRACFPTTRRTGGARSAGGSAWCGRGTW